MKNNYLCSKIKFYRHQWLGFNRKGLKMKPYYFALPVTMILAAVLLHQKLASHQDNHTAYRTHLVRQTLPLPTLPENNTIASYWYDEEVQTGDNLSLVLKRLGVSEHSIQMFLRQSPINTKLLQLHAGQIISARIDSAHDITDIQFFNDNDDGERNLIAIEKVNGKWQMNAGVVDTETLPSLRAVTLQSDGATSGMLARAGVPVEIRTSLKEVFADKINLDDLKAGDSIRVLYESLYFRGQEVATGSILAAEIVAGGQTYYGYYFENGTQSGAGNYYDERGEALKKGFAGFPLETYTHISSPYGIRIHPILHTVKMHTGIDYAAPLGTKVFAPSDGVVNYRGWKGGYGNTIMISHGNGLETLYAHLSAFVSDVDVGTKVSAGTLIGQVGSTGNSTGSHLHYEVRINGQHVNPASVALPTPKLTVHDVAALRRYQQKTDAVMRAIRGLSVMVSQID